MLGHHERAVLAYVLNLEDLAHRLLVAGVDSVCGKIRPDVVESLSLGVLKALHDVVSEILPGNLPLVHQIDIPVQERGLL